MQLKQSLLIFVLVLTVVAGCVTSGPLTDIPLVWKPTDDIYDIETATLTSLYTKKIKIIKFTDKRENKFEIGRNIESQVDRAVTTKDDVAVWCTDRFRAILGQLGLNIVDSNEDVILKGEIMQFYVLEKETYNSTVGFKIIAEAPAGQILWQGITSGQSTRFGKSYSSENYYEALGNAYLKAVHGLLKSREFSEAIKQ